MNAPEPTTLGEYIDLVLADTAQRLTRLLERMEEGQRVAGARSEVEELVKESVR